MFRELQHLFVNPIYILLVIGIFQNCSDEPSGDFPTVLDQSEKNIDNTVDPNDGNINDPIAGTDNSSSQDNKDVLQQGDLHADKPGLRIDVPGVEEGIELIRGELILSVYDIKPERFANMATFEFIEQSTPMAAQMFHYNAETATKVCNMLQYAKAELLVSRGFSSPQDNTIASWSKSDNKFYVDYAHNVGNIYIYSLRCFTP